MEYKFENELKSCAKIPLRARVRDEIEINNEGLIMEYKFDDLKI